MRTRPLPRLVLVASALLLASVHTPATAQHPQAVTDCSNCHVDRSTGQTDLWLIHDYECSLCHPGDDFDRTVLGPIGTWNHECTACHNAARAITGNLSTITKGHRCVVCHGRQMSVEDPVEIHAEHTDKANCVVCHGFVPDLGTAIGSGNRQGCTLCHERVPQSSLRSLHEQMTRHGLSCLECHADERPPVDVVPGLPVGMTTVVCDVCHSGRSPTLFAARGAELHRRHRQRGLDCGSCHLDANLQEDRAAMPPPDDARRSLLDRSGRNECVHCHGRTPNASTPSVHQRHRGMWCYDCHEGTDLRPLGEVPPVQSPRQACVLCHGGSGGGEGGGDDDDGAGLAAGLPFGLHREHTEEGVACFACHQGRPPLQDWPRRWLRPQGVLATYGTGCSGAGAPPALAIGGSARPGGTIQVTLSGAPASVPVVLAIGARGQSMDLARDGMDGCTMLVDVGATAGTVARSNGTAAFAQRVPSLPELVGEAVYFQWFVPVPGANALGVAASNGGRATVGN